MLTIFIYVFICTWDKKFCTCPVNQLPTVRPSSFTRSQISHCRNQQQPLHSRTVSMCSRWHHYEQPRLNSLLTWMKAFNTLGQCEHFSYLLIFHLLVLGYCPSPYVTLRILHVAPPFQKLARQIFPTWGTRTPGIRSRTLHCLFTLLFHCFLISLLVYLCTVTTYKFEITANTLITKILLIWRVQLMEIGCHGLRKWTKKNWEPLS